MTKATYRTPWSIEGRGDTTAICDHDDNLILEAPWDGKANGEGGVNDLLLALIEHVNGMGERLAALDEVRQLPYDDDSYTIAIAIPHETWNRL